MDMLAMFILILAAPLDASKGEIGGPYRTGFTAPNASAYGLDLERTTRLVSLNMSDGDRVAAFVDARGTMRAAHVDEQTIHSHRTLRDRLPLDVFNWMRSTGKPMSLVDTGSIRRVQWDATQHTWPGETLAPWTHDPLLRWEPQPLQPPKNAAVGKVVAAEAAVSELLGGSGSVGAAMGSGIRMLMEAVSLLTPGGFLPLFPTMVRKMVGSTSGGGRSLIQLSDEPKVSVVPRVTNGTSLLALGGEARVRDARVDSETGEDPEVWTRREQGMEEQMFEFCMHVVIILSFAVAYAQNVVVKRPKVTALTVYEAERRMKMAQDEEPQFADGFSFSLFGCCKDPTYMAYSFCCPHIRAADTLCAAGIISFEMGLLLYFMVFICQHFGPSFNMCAMIILSVPMASNRRKIREKYGGKKCNGIRDYLSSCCCWTCAICQEARHVDEATQTRVNCCFKIEYYGDPFDALVGPAIHIGGAASAEILEGIRNGSREDLSKQNPEAALKRTASYLRMPISEQNKDKLFGTSGSSLDKISEGTTGTAVSEVPKADLDDDPKDTIWY